jgi:hypothetical protein
MDLHEAASCGDVAHVEALLDQGVQVDALDAWENTPLLLACFSQVHHRGVVALLRDRGADPHHRNIYWETPRSKAHQRLLMSGFDPLGDLPAPEVPETEAGDLTDEEMDVMAAAVRAVVDRDQPALEAMKAFDGGNPYEWTQHDYGRWGDAHPVLPPGDPRTWIVHVLRYDDDSLAVDIDMWTREEGRSDLTLELKLSRQPGGAYTAKFQNLHVM